jgi:hypothetical protein
MHDVDNLFLVDGSIHVTNGGINPVLTIMAITYYASAHLVEGWMRNVLPGLKIEMFHALTATGMCSRWKRDSVGTVFAASPTTFRANCPITSS